MTVIRNVLNGILIEIKNVPTGNSLSFVKKKKNIFNDLMDFINND